MTQRQPIRWLGALCLLIAGTAAAQQTPPPTDPTPVPDVKLELVVPIPETPPPPAWPPDPNKPRTLEQVCLVEGGVYGAEDMCQGLVVDGGDIEIDIPKWCELMEDMPLPSPNPYACKLNEIFEHGMTTGDCIDDYRECLDLFDGNDTYAEVKRVCELYAGKLGLDCDIPRTPASFCRDWGQDCQYAHRPECHPNDDWGAATWRCGVGEECGERDNTCVPRCTKKCVYQDFYNYEPPIEWECPATAQCSIWTDRNGVTQYRAGQCWDATNRRQFTPSCSSVDMVIL